jgi:hypothetical protein
MATIDKFISVVKGDGLARTNRFVVMFTPTFVPLGGGDWPLENILMFCDQVQIPGTNFNTTANRVFGESRETPYERLYEPISMSFYVDRGMFVKELFDTWMEAIQDPETRLFNFYDNYTVDISIYVEDTLNKKRYFVGLKEAYPKSIDPIQLDTSSKDIMKMNVHFAYKYYVTQAVEGDFHLQQSEIDQAMKNRYSPDFTTNPAPVSQTPQNTFMRKLQNFAIGAIGSKLVTKLPSLLKRR